MNNLMKIFLIVSFSATTLTTLAANAKYRTLNTEEANKVLANLKTSINSRSLGSLAFNEARYKSNYTYDIIDRTSISHFPCHIEIDYSEDEKIYSLRLDVNTVEKAPYFRLVYPTIDSLQMPLSAETITRSLPDKNILEVRTVLVQIDSENHKLLIHENIRDYAAGKSFSNKNELYSTENTMIIQLTENDMNFKGVTAISNINVNRTLGTIFSTASEEGSQLTKEQVHNTHIVCEDLAH